MNDRILRALRREPTDRTPVWFMRQAGRALPRYRERRADAAFYELIRDPQAAAEITAMPLDYFPMDAAVLYSDLTIPFFAAGLEQELKPGMGPVVADPIVTPADIDRLQPFDPREKLPYTFQAIRLLKERLDVPVLGFVGAPFTVASYLIKGQKNRDLDAVKAFIFRDPGAWERLAGFWAHHMAEYAVAQHEAGAAAVQIFDSWAGVLGPEEYDRHVLPHAAAMFGRLREAGVPSINFFNGNPALLPLVAAAGGDCVSVDWRLPIDHAWELIGEDQAIQGNLDPASLLAGREYAVAKTREILERVDGRPGHIFNLGHGLLPTTDHEVARAVVDFVQDFTGRKNGGAA